MQAPAMSHRFISELRAGLTLKQFFIVRRVENRLTREGKRFLALVLGDRTGAVKARVWEETLKKCPHELSECDFVGVTGLVESYQGELQINVTYIEPVDKIRERGGLLHGFDPELLVLSTDRNREELWQELWELASTRLHPPLRDLVLAILERYQEELMVWPGAETVHHAYLGGLLEHTCSVARHACHSLEVYRFLNPDLVLAGAILHDIGKIKELSNPECPKRTVAGGLVGHIVLGWEMVREEARTLDFPDDHLLRELEHIIISHHGAAEFGSPVLPKTPEALLVYYLDEIDAKLHMARRHLELDAGDQEFTEYHRLLERRLYKSPNSREDLPLTDPETED
ncbi:MAG: HD domain-containing protein [Deltaproteobacteria bacterium]|nr:HD domain-containing protein [Deltaproteobacteria bacterium]